MPSLAQLKKKVSELHLSFIKDMEGLGFSMGPGSFWLYRRRGDILDIIDFDVGSTGNWAKVNVMPMIDELMDDYDMSDFPKGFSKILSNPFSTVITEDGIEHPWHKWKVADDNSIRETFNALSKIMIEKGDAWLKAIKTKKDVYKLIDEQGE